MTIEAMENRTKVRSPEGHIGRILLTRRERELIDRGKLETAKVLGVDGLTRYFAFKDLVEVVPEPEPCPYCDDGTCPRCGGDF